jgi:branched-chain amino acid transport system ATP-binding protein
MLELRDIHARYGAVRVLHGISLEVQQGELVAVVGANGAGKSTTLSTIAGVVRPSAGEIVFKGEAITGQTPETIVRKGIAMVPENRDIFSALTVEQNLRLGAYIRGDRAEYLRDLDQMFELFPILADRRGQAAGTMSGGEQQQLAIARALMSHPQLLIFDEPSLGLSPKLVDQVFALVQKLHKEGMTILLVEQNVAQALNIADRAYLIRMGRVEAAGTPQELRQTVDVESAYLGAATAQAASGREL